MKLSKIAGAGSLLLALTLTAVHAEPEVHPVQLAFLASCHQGLVVWLPLPPAAKCGQMQIPQVKIFDNAGRLRFIGSALDAIQWAKAGQPPTPIPNGVIVRDMAAEARITHASAPLPGHGWVSYYGWTDCPPCRTQMVTFRAEVMSKLGAGTGLGVYDLSGPDK